MAKYREIDVNSVNTNEIQTDYHFYLQLIMEERVLDFEYDINS